MGFIQRINKIYIPRCDELVLDEDRGRHGLLLQDRQCQRNDLVTIPLRKVRHGPDQTCTGATKFVAGLANRVLADHSTLLARACFFKGAQSSESAHIIHAANKGAFGGSASEVLAYGLQDLFKVSTAVQVDDRNIGDRGQFGTKPVHETRNAELKERAADREFEQKQLLYLSLPMFARPSSERLAADDTRLVVIRAEVRRAGWGISIAITGVLASRNLDAITGATRS